MEKYRIKQTAKDKFLIEKPLRIYQQDMVIKEYWVYAERTEFKTLEEARKRVKELQKYPIYHEPTNDKPKMNTTIDLRTKKEKEAQDGGLKHRVSHKHENQKPSIDLPKQLQIECRDLTYHTVLKFDQVSEIRLMTGCAKETAQWAEEANKGMSFERIKSLIEQGVKP